MVVGGYHSEGESEIIDLSGQNLNCPTIANYPINGGQVGTFINNKPFVCGGYDGRDVFSECNSYNLHMKNCLLSRSLDQVGIRRVEMFPNDVRNLPG